MKRLLVILPLLGLLAHAGLPEWFVHIPPAGKNEYVAVGAGNDMETATRQALTQIASQLNVSVSGSYAKSEQLTNANGEEHYFAALDIQTKSEVGRVEFNNYTVVKNSFEGGQQYVLVRVDKQTLLAERLDRFRAIDAEIDTRASHLDGAPAVVRLRNGLRIVALIREARPLINGIASIDPTILNREVYRNKYVALERKIRADINRIVFVLDVRNDDLDFVARGVEERMSEIEMTSTSDGQAVKEKGAVVIAISGKVKSTKAYGSYKLDAFVTFKTSENGIVTSRISHKMHAESPSDYRSAQRVMEAELTEQIDAKGLMNYLGVL